MTTVIQHYDVSHIPLSSSPGKSGVNPKTEIDSGRNAFIAVNPSDSLHPSSSRLQWFSLQVTEMWSCGNKTHSVPSDVLLEQGRNMYQCYDYRMLARWHSQECKYLNSCNADIQIKKQSQNRLFSKVNMTMRPKLCLSPVNHHLCSNTIHPIY